jgi:hypothetical protein
MSQPKCTNPQCECTQFVESAITLQNHQDKGKLNFIICAKCGTIIESLAIYDLEKKLTQLLTLLNQELYPLRKALESSQRI